MEDVIPPVLLVSFDERKEIPPRKRENVSVAAKKTGTDCQGGPQGCRYATGEKG